jgi:hypothetical protein
MRALRWPVQGNPELAGRGDPGNLIRRVLMGSRYYETCLNRTCGPVPARTALRDRRTAIGVEAEWEKVRAGLVNYIEPVALSD